MAQFCTEHLKRNPLVAQQLEIQDTHPWVESWQGVRRDESRNRRNAVPWEYSGSGIAICRPIVNWTAQQTVDYVRSKGVNLNPLYSLGASRVGCMPCINAKKEEILNIANRFPEHIERIAEWEKVVAQVSKRSGATFFEVSGDNNTAMERGNIWQKVKWSKTRRGGREMDWIKSYDEIPACKSSYGLCE